MMHRLERGLDAAEKASHDQTPQDKIHEHVRTHLAEVHAFESQTIELLKKSEKIAGSASLAAVYGRSLDQIRHHSQLVEQRLKSLDSDSSSIKDSALTVGGLNWGFFFQAQSDTPAKLAAFVYAVLHLEIGGYELLKRTARRVDDVGTQELSEKIVGEKRTIADELSAEFDSAVAATLHALNK